MNWPLRLAQSVIPPGLHWFLGLKHSEVHGRARWMNAREEHAFLASGHPGLVLGPGRRLSWDESFKNLVLMAPTGSGKTTRYVIPQALLRRRRLEYLDQVAPPGEVPARCPVDLAGGVGDHRAPLELDTTSSGV